MATRKKRQEEAEVRPKPVGPKIELDPGREGYGAVVRRDGKIVSLPLDMIQSGEAYQKGYRIATAEEAKEADLERRAGTLGQTALGLVEAPVRGALFGLYDAAAIGAGADPDMLRQRKKQLGMTGDILEIGGAVAPAFFTGGGGGLAGLLARGGTAATTKAVGRAGMGKIAKEGIGTIMRHTPAGLAARAGRATEPALARLMTTRAAGQTPGLLARSAATGIVGAGESALYGMGESMSEAAHLGDYGLAAELIMANTGGNALMGGTAATAFSLATGALGRGITKAATTARNAAYGRKLRPGAEAVDEAYAKAKATGEVTQDVQSKMDIHIEETTQGTDIKKVKSEWDNLKRMENAHVEGKSIRDDWTDEATLYLNDRARTKTKVRDAIKMQHKIKFFQNAMKVDPPANIGAINKYALDITDDILEKAEIIANLPGNLPGTATHLNKYLLKPAMRDGGHVDQLLKLSDMKDTAKAAGAAMGIVDDMKRRLGRATKKHIRGDLKGTPAEDALKDYYEELRVKLEDAAMWGSTSAEAQRILNRAYFEDITLGQSKSAWINESRPRERIAWNDIYLADRDKIAKAMRGAHRAHVEKEADVLLTSIDTETNLLRRLLEFSDGVDPKTKELIKEFDEKGVKVKKLMNQASELNVDMEKWEEGMRRTENLPFVLGAGRKMVIKGAASANAMSRMTTLAESVSNTSAKVKSTVKATVNKAKETGKKLKEGVKVIEEAVPLTPVIIDDEETLKKKYDKAVERDSQYQQNPQLLQNRVIDFSQNFSDVAPNTTFALMDNTARASEFMRSKQPQPPLRVSDFMAHTTDRQRVSDSQMAKYLRYREGLEPMQALDKLAKGQISREGAETFRTVYPQMFAMVKREFGEQLISATDPLPLRDLTHFSILLDTPLHPSLEPRYVHVVQQMYKKERQDRKPPQTRKSPDMAKSHASRSHQLA